MTTTDETTELPRFSAALRDATWQDHEQAEHATFMSALLAGDLPLDAYADLAAQQWFVYAMLEAAADEMAADPVAAPFVFPELTRLPAIEADLVHLVGADWTSRIEPLPATTAYCDRIRAVCFDQPGAFVAHHYTRYLGDLSGGQHIGRVVKRVYGLDDDLGASFFSFARIPDAKAFKDAYRARLDAAPWSPADQAAVIAEIREAYRLNRDLVAGLDATLVRNFSAHHGAPHSRTEISEEVAGFPTAEVVAAVARHMNEDHADDSVLICRALGGEPSTVAATMTGMDADGADFVATTDAGPIGVRIPWSERLTERAQVRAEVVRLYHEACAALGVEPRPPVEH